MRVGEIFLEMQKAAPTALLRHTGSPLRVGDRPVTDESRLVTAPILLVNAGVRKHWIAVSGLTRRTFRRAATRARDDRLRGYESPDFRDEPRTAFMPERGPGMSWLTTSHSLADHVPLYGCGLTTPGSVSSPPITQLNASGACAAGIQCPPSNFRNVTSKPRASSSSAIGMLVRSIARTESS